MHINLFFGEQSEARVTAENVQNLEYQRSTYPIIHKIISYLNYKVNLRLHVMRIYKHLMNVHLRILSIFVL